MGLCLLDCSGGSRNTGQPSGVKPFGKPVAIVLVNLYANDGTENVINCLTDTFDPAFLTTMLNETADKRWYPVMGLKNALSIRAESNKQTFDDGDLEVVSQGIRDFKALSPSKSRAYLGQLKNQTCEDIGFYVIDTCGNFLGSEKVENNLRPIRMSVASWEAILVWATDASNQAINIAFNFASTERDEDHGFIDASQITADLSIMKGLIDINLDDAVSVVIPKTIEFDANAIYGGCANKIGIESLVLGDWTVLLNGVAEIVISSVLVGKHYVLTLTSVIAPADIITVNATKTGFDVNTLTHTVL